MICILLALSVVAAGLLVARRGRAAWMVLATLAWAAVALLIAFAMMPFWDAPGPEAPAEVIARAIVLSGIASVFMAVRLARPWMAETNAAPAPPRLPEPAAG